MRRADRRAASWTDSSSTAWRAALVLSGTLLPCFIRSPTLLMTGQRNERTRGSGKPGTGPWPAALNPSSFFHSSQTGPASHVRALPMTAHSAKSDLARQGQAATAVRARPGMVGFALVRQTPVLALLVGVPGLAAMVEQERALAIALLLPAGILAGLGIWSRRLSSSDELRRIEAVATLALIFVLSAVLAVPAFMVLGLNPLDAFFEATSGITTRSEEHTSELQSLRRISYAVFCLKKK